MDATRARPWRGDPETPPMPLWFEPDRSAQHLQWVVAAALVLALIVVVSLAVRELRLAPWSLDAADDSTASTILPREAMSVPVLALAAGQRVLVGELRPDAVAQLRSLKLLKRLEEPGPLGVREVRAYQGVTLVFEPFERAGAPRVAAIYLQ
jgi:hypothetical protein